MENLFTALALAQGEMTRVKKSATNPHLKNKYTPLDDILAMARPILAKHGLAFMQKPVMLDGEVGVHGVIAHKSGESYDVGTLTLPLGRGGGAQGAGSSITYAKRYQYSAVFGIETGDTDDDGNAAQQAKPSDEHRAIQEVLKKVAEDHGRDEAQEILKQLGVKKVAELKDGALEKIMELVQNLGE